MADLAHLGWSAVDAFLEVAIHTLTGLQNGLITSGAIERLQLPPGAHSWELLPEDLADADRRARPPAS